MNPITKIFSSYRLLNGLMFIIATTAMAVALLFMQKHLGLDACPLCIFQRVGMIVIAVFSFISMVFNPKQQWAKLTLWFGSLAGALWGLAVAGRHVWLQHLPADKVPSCGPGLDYWLDVLPIAEVFQEVFKGSGECADISWKFLGMSIPEQTLLVFSFLLILHLVLVVKIIKSKC